ncbi:MAG: hypothetical protein H7122_04045 [Chitinophagaceae bacterium]|nr:hypothetical protein [Chitinophagaceae bacterium]
MAKVTVKANEDFFDRANQILRKKGSEFILKSEYAKSLGNQIKVSESIEKKHISKTKEKVELNASGKPRDMDSSRIKGAVKKK